MDDAEQLLPMYLRFVKGVIDTADLPLNVSREILQESRDVKSIRDGNARRILTVLASLANSDEADKQEKYKQFYAEFGNVLKKAWVKTKAIWIKLPNYCGMPLPLMTMWSPALTTIKVVWKTVKKRFII